MTHSFLIAVADGLAVRGVATLRYQFPYLERGSRRPDRPELAHATVRAAVSAATRHWRKLPLFVGGKSFGGGMTSQAQADTPMADVRGLIFLGFPLHPPGKPSTERAHHLAEVTVPMLFLQGTRDDFAKLRRLKGVVHRLRRHATLKLLTDADHSFHVPARSGRTDAEVLEEALDGIAAWVLSHTDKNRSRG